MKNFVIKTISLAYLTLFVATLNGAERLGMGNPENAVKPIATAHQALNGVVDKAVATKATKLYPDLFCKAANAGSITSMEKLFATKALPIDTQNKDKETALFVAAKAGKDQVVKWLLQHGADKNLYSNRVSPLSIATRGGHEEVVELLLAHGSEHDYDLALDQAVDEAQTAIAQEWQKLVKNTKENIRKYVSDSSGKDPRKRAANLAQLEEKLKNLDDPTSVLSQALEKGFDQFMKALGLTQGQTNAPKMGSASASHLYAGGYDAKAQQKQKNILVPIAYAQVRAAVKEKDIDELKRLKAQGITLDTLHSNGCTVLMYFADLLSADKLGWLLEECPKHGLDKPDVNKVDTQEACTPLLCACARGQEKDCDPQALGETLKLLLKAGANPNVKDINGYTPLSCVSKHPALVKLLKEHGANPDYKDGNGDTPLMTAVKITDEYLVVALINTGAAVSLAIIEEAQQRGDKEIIAHLERVYNASDSIPSEFEDEQDESEEDETDFDLLFDAIMDTNISALLDLHKRGITLDILSPQGATALMHLVNDKQIHIIDWLFQECQKHGIEKPDVNKRDSMGRTAILHLCLDEDKKDNVEKAAAMLDVLLKAGANPNIKDKIGNTPLTYVNDFDRLVGILKGAGADPNYKDEQGKTMLESAIASGSTMLVNAAMRVGAKITPEAKLLANKKGPATIDALKNKSIQDSAHAKHVVDSKQSKAKRLEQIQSLDDAGLIKWAGLTENSLHKAGHKGKLAHFAYMGRTALVEKIIALPGVNIEGRNTQGWTPFLAAALQGKDECVSLLSKAGCNIFARDGQSGETALSLAWNAGQVKTYKQLTEDLATLKIEDLKGEALKYYVTDSLDVLVQLIAVGNLAAVETILSPTALVKIAKQGIDAGLRVAVEKGQAAIVKFLLSKGAEDDKVGSLLALAQDWRAGEIVELLQAHQEIKAQKAQQELEKLLGSDSAKQEPKTSKSNKKKKSLGQKLVQQAAEEKRKKEDAAKEALRIAREQQAEKEEQARKDAQEKQERYEKQVALENEKKRIKEQEQKERDEQKAQKEKEEVQRRQLEEARKEQERRAQQEKEQRLIAEQQQQENALREQEERQNQERERKALAEQDAKLANRAQELALQKEAQAAEKRTAELEKQARLNYEKVDKERVEMLKSQARISKKRISAMLDQKEKELKDLQENQERERKALAAQKESARLRALNAQKAYSARFAQAEDQAIESRMLDAHLDQVATKLDAKEVEKNRERYEQLRKQQIEAFEANRQPEPVMEDKPVAPMKSLEEAFKEELIRRGDKDLSEEQLRAIKRGVAIDTLFKAALTGNTDIAQDCIDCGIFVNATNSLNQTTPLMAAVSAQRLDMVKFLINRGAAYNEITNINGDTPGILAALKYKFDNDRRILDYLTKVKRVNTNLSNSQGKSILTILDEKFAIEKAQAEQELARLQATLAKALKGAGR